jgi:hypothetical protein
MRHSTQIAGIVCGTAFAIGGLTGCKAPPGTASAHQLPLRHHNWWNFFERGQLHLAAGNFELARADFETSLGIRPGAKYGHDRERWWEITYGVHGIENYFPNRELGVALFHLGEWNGARKNLIRSHSETPSGRAKHYLNLVHGKLLEGATVPIPNIEFSRAEPTVWTRSEWASITGTVEADGLIQNLAVNGSPRFIELAETRLHFSERIALQPGTNTMTIEAMDLVGQQANRQQTWMADWQKPHFYVRSIQSAPKGWTAETTWEDDHGLKRIIIGGVEAFDASKGDRRRRVDLRIPIPDRGHLITAAAEDFAGNRTQVEIPGRALIASSRAMRPVLYASTAPPGVTDTGSPTVAAPPADRLEPTLEVSVAGRPIKLFNRHLFIDGWAEDGSGLSGVFISGEPRLPESQAGVRRAYFSRRIKLRPGENEISIEAHDMAGNIASEVVTAWYEPAEFEMTDFRLTMGIPPVAEALDSQIASWTRAAIEGAVASPRPRFVLLERYDGLDHLLQEHGISVSILCDQQAKLPLGKFHPAELYLFSGYLPQSDGVTIVAKVVETGDGRVACFEDVYIPELKDTDSLKYQIDGLVRKVEQQFPLATGEVVVLRNRNARLNIGSEDGIRPGVRFVASRPESSKDFDGSLRQHDGRRIELVIESVKESVSTARIQPEAGRSALSVGDVVHAR